MISTSTFSTRIIFSKYKLIMSFSAQTLTCPYVQYTVQTLAQCSMAWQPTSPFSHSPHFVIPHSGKQDITAPHPCLTSLLFHTISCLNISLRIFYLFFKGLTICSFWQYVSPDLKSQSQLHLCKNLYNYGIYNTFPFCFVP